MSKKDNEKAKQMLKEFEELITTTSLDEKTEKTKRLFRETSDIINLAIIRILREVKDDINCYDSYDVDQIIEGLHALKRARDQFKPFGR